MENSNGMNEELYEDKTIITSRILSFGNETVFAAFENPELLASWWGPNGFTNTFHSFDLVSDGAWQFTMHGNDGQNFECNHRFVEIIKSSRFVFDHLQEGHNFRGIYDLHDESGQTKLTFTMIFEDTEECKRVRPFVEPANEQNFDRLQTLLSSEKTK